MCTPIGVNGKPNLECDRSQGSYAGDCIADRRPALCKHRSKPACRVSGLNAVLGWGRRPEARRSAPGNATPLCRFEVRKKRTAISGFEWVSNYLVETIRSGGVFVPSMPGFSCTSPNARLAAAANRSWAAPIPVVRPPELLWHVTIWLIELGQGVVMCAKLIWIRLWL